MSELPHRLAQGDHRVTYRPKRDDAVAELREAVERAYVHVLFPETRGGTELGFPLDGARSDLSNADWEQRKGSVHLEGELRLDGVPVRCVTDIDLATNEGTGRLVILGEQATG